MKTFLLAVTAVAGVAAVGVGLDLVSTEAALAFAFVAAAWGPGLFLLACDYRPAKWDPVRSWR